MKLDVAIFTESGRLYGVEIKVSDHDARYDAKWPRYLEYCQSLIFAFTGSAKLERIPSHFPVFRMPESASPDEVAACLLQQMQQAGLSPAETRRAVSALRASIPKPT